MTKDYTVLITAVDRPELHTKVIESYLNYLNNVKCKWIITVNNISNKIDETVSNFYDLLKDQDYNIKTFTTGGSRLDWYNSVKYCINTAFEYKPNAGHIWLEDDWLYASDVTLDKDLIFLEDSDSYISLANRPEVSFNPSIWGTNLFNKLMVDSINKPEESLGKRYLAGDITNPERICCPHPESTNAVDKFKTLNRFKDIGRSWQENTIKKRTFKLS